MQIEAYIEQTYGVAGEYPFFKDPETCVFRHQKNRKWFAVVMVISSKKLGMDEDRPVKILNVKCDSRLIGSFREEPGIFPAYHMSKNHWLTLLTDGTVGRPQLQFLMDMSYDLTKK